MSVTWDADYRNTTLPIEHQGGRGTCLSLATTTARRGSGSYSAEYAHFMSKAFGGPGRFESVGAVLDQQGQPSRSQWVYDPYLDEESTAYCVPPSVVGPFSFADLEIASTLPTFQELLQRAFAVPSVILGLRVVDSFYTPTEGLILPSRVVPAAHAVFCVGTGSYSGPSMQGLQDGEAVLCIQNSWGDAWGEAGCGYVPASTYVLAGLKVAEVMER